MVDEQTTAEPNGKPQDESLKLVGNAAKIFMLDMISTGGSGVELMLRGDIALMRGKLEKCPWPISGGYWLRTHGVEENAEHSDGIVAFFLAEDVVWMAPVTFVEEDPPGLTPEDLKSLGIDP